MQSSSLLMYNSPSPRPQMPPGRPKNHWFSKEEPSFSLEESSFFKKGRIFIFSCRIFNFIQKRTMMWRSGQCRWHNRPRPVHQSGPKSVAKQSQNSEKTVEKQRKNSENQSTIVTSSASCLRLMKFNCRFSRQYSVRQMIKMIKTTPAFVQNPSFFDTDPSLLIQNPSFLIQNSSLLMQKQSE